MSLKPITSPLLSGMRHGFFTRQGGLSTGIYAGLNTGPGSGDSAEAVAANRQAAADHLGANALLSVHQIHSDRVVVAAPDNSDPRPRADAMVTDRPGIALGVLSADCAPVLLADREAGVVGAAHAGWRGALGGVLEATLAAMVQLGADPRHIVGAVGPCISQRAYEVGPEFLDRFEADDPETLRFFANGADDRLQFDLPGFVLHRLRAAGVAEAGWTGHCTYSDPVRFYSYRRSTHATEPDYGRLLSAIRL